MTSVDTALPRSIVPARLQEANRRDQVAAYDNEWVQFQTWEFKDLPTDQQFWYVCANVWADVDDGVTGTIRIRIGQRVNGQVVTSEEAVIDAPCNGALLGFVEFSTPTTPLPSTLVFVEGRRTAYTGTGGGLHLHRAAVSAMSQPPVSLRGGPTYPAGYTVPGSDVIPPDIPASQVLYFPEGISTNGGSLGQFTATDDVAVTSFTITAGNTGGAVAMDSSGNVTVADFTALNANHPLQLTLRAEDAAGNFTTQTATIAETDDTTPPDIPSGQTYTVDPAAANGSQVATIIATDNAGVVFMDIVNGTNTNGAFWLEPSTGILYVNSQTAVAGESQFLLDVLARDGVGNETTEVVTVNVQGASPTSGTFRSVSTPRTSYSASLPWQPPTGVAPLPAAVAPSGSGIERQVTSESEWNTAVAAAQPGDVIRIMNTINTTAGLNYRGSKYGITGGVANDGTATNPIILTAEPGAWIDGGATSNVESMLDVQNADHIWAVGINVRNSRFGMRFQNMEGTATAPIRIAHCNFEDLGHSAVSVAGWFQDVASSGGTPPAGSGNERGYSRYVILEGNTATRMGRTDTNFGEGIAYLGTGSAPGWFSYAEFVCIRYNEINEHTADGVDVKPGCKTVYIHDNQYHSGSGHDGATLGIHYSAASYPRPAWAVGRDPEIWVESNRLYDHNITNPVGSSGPWIAYYGTSGIRMAFNLAWAWSTAAGHEMTRLRIETSEADYGTDTSHFVNNTAWSNTAFNNAGAGTGGSFTGPVANPPIQRNNLVETGDSGEFTTGDSAFSGT
ncbi:MAG: hypothetical protein AAGC53_23080, partial [Actinomycetota bacterium]